VLRQCLGQLIHLRRRKTTAIGSLQGIGSKGLGYRTFGNFAGIDQEHI